MLERRAFARYFLTPERGCSVNVVLGGSRWPARVADLSTDGIGILSDCWLPPETTLFVELSPTGTNPARTFLVHVRHATPKPSGGYQLGARLVNHLTEGEVREMVNSSERT